jgi:hypothetical protein
LRAASTVDKSTIFYSVPPLWLFSTDEPPASQMLKEHGLTGSSMTPLSTSFPEFTTPVM